MTELREQYQIQPVPTFDYSQLDDGVRKFVLDRKQDMLKRNGLAIIADGHDLLAIKQAIKGKFYEWLKTEYWFSPRTAEKRMQVAEMVDAKSELNSDFESRTISELYELAAAHHKPQNEDQQEVEKILGDLGLEMQSEDDIPLPDGTDIDVPALVAKCQQLESANATLETQLQEALRQSNDSPTPVRHYGGGGHHKTPEKEEGGIVRRMRNYDGKWPIEEMKINPGWNCADYDESIVTLQGGNSIEVWGGNSKQHRQSGVTPLHMNDIPSFVSKRDDTNKQLMKRYNAWKNERNKVKVVSDGTE